MKKQNFFIIIWVICVCLFPTLTFASDNVVVDIISVTPSELTGDGTVNISFELSNHSDADLTSVSISIEDSVFDFSGSQAIPASGSAILPIALPLTLSQLDKPLVFTIKWISGGEPYYATAETTVIRTVDPTISLTRKISDKHARTGQQVTITYTLKNPTKFDMTEVTLIDEQISGEPIRKNDVLLANGSFTIDQPFIMGTTDVVSAPVVTYIVNERTKSYSGVKPATIVYSDISVGITADKKNTDLNGTEFEVTVHNTGASDVFGVTITDSEGTVVNTEPVDLKTGESKSFSYFAAPLTSNQPKQISFSFTGKDSFGDPLETNSTGVFLINPFYDDSQFSVHLSAQVMTPPQVDNMNAEIKFSIDNKSLLPLSDVRILGSSAVPVATVDFLSSGVTDIIQWIQADMDSDLEFFIEGRDDSGSNHQLGSVIISKENLNYNDITSIENIPDPTNDPYSVAAPNLWQNFIFRILVVIGAVMVLSCTVLIALRVLDVGRVEVKETKIDDFFKSVTGDPMQNENYNSIYDAETDLCSDPESVDKEYDFSTSIMDGPAPKHIEIKKAPKKKKKKKTETRRIG